MLPLEEIEAITQYSYDPYWIEPIKRPVNRENQGLQAAFVCMLCSDECDFNVSKIDFKSWTQPVHADF